MKNLSFLFLAFFLISSGIHSLYAQNSGSTTNSTAGEANTANSQTKPSGDQSACDKFQKNFAGALHDGIETARSFIPGTHAENRAGSVYDKVVEAASEAPACLKEIQNQATTNFTVSSPSQGFTTPRGQKRTTGNQ